MTYQSSIHQFLSVLAVCFLLQSCGKEAEIIPLSANAPENATLNSVNFRSEGGGGIEEVQEIYDSIFVNTEQGTNCEMLYSLVQLSSDFLEFRDSLHFVSVLECLELSVEAYNDAFESIYGGLTDDEVDIVEEQIGFFDDQPLADFEDRFRFYSLRKEIEKQEEVWLANTILDDNNDPDDHFVVDEELRTLLSVNCIAKIGSETVDFCYADDPARLGICIFSDCCHTGSEKNIFPYNNGNRRFKVRVALRAYFVGSTAKAKVKHYKRKSNGGWKKSRSKLFAQVLGSGRDNNCVIINNIGATKSEKRRKRRVAKWQWWGAFSPIRAQNDNDILANGTADGGNQQGIVPLIIGN